MPKITFPLDDLRSLARDPRLDLARLEELLLLVKGELDSSTEEEVKVELQDTNRPDSWTVEGIARQIRLHRGEPVPDAAALTGEGRDPAGAIEVDASVADVRPYVAGFVARGHAVDDAGLRAFISAQEVLCRNFGRQRKGVAIGIYDGAAMRFPVRYEAAPLDDRRRAFSPLRPEGDATDASGKPIPEARWDEPWTPGEILRDHPTGREYAAALEGAERAPILVDAAGAVLSFPPLINSATLGRVVPGMDTLFVEVTGLVLDQVLLATNILAANLADRGASIEPVVTRYPFDTPRGREVRAPHPLEDKRTLEVPLAEARRLLGEPDLQPDPVRRHLAAYGVAAEVEGETLRATIPPYRLDYLHPVDAIEDFAISRGYDRFSPLLPEEFTVGGLDPATELSDRVREVLIGCGFEEAIGNLLTSDEEVRGRMRVEETGPPGALHGGPLVRIDNVMNRNYAVLRDWLLPTLLEVERRSSGALYPHRVFESGEVALWAPEENMATRTELRLGALLAHDRAGFSELQATLDELLGRLGFAFAETSGRDRYALELTEHPSFIPGRVARIAAGGAELGILGEVHPAVLEAWGIYFPTVAFEVRLDPLRELLGPALLG